MARPLKPRDPSIVEVRLDFAVCEFVAVALRKAAPQTIAVKKTTLNVMLDLFGPAFPVWRLTKTEMGMVNEKAINGETVEEAAAFGRTGRAVRTGRNTKEGIGQVRTTLEQFINFCTNNRPWMPIGVVVPGEVFKPSREDLGDVDEAEEPLRFAYEDWSYILDLAQSIHPRCRIATALGLLLGRRASEAIHMQWKRIDWERQVIHVFNVKRRRWVWMPLHPELAKELMWWREWLIERHGEIDPEWYVVPAKLQSRDIKGAGSQVRLRDNPEQWPIDPSKQSRVSSMVREARRLLAILGYGPNQHSGTHTWRRSAARYLSEQYGILTAQAMLDHSDVRTTQGYTGNSEGTKTLFAALLPGVTPPGGFGLENVEKKAAPAVERFDNVIPIRRSA